MMTNTQLLSYFTQKITNSTASSLRFSRPRGEANEKKRFSESFFRFNTLYFTYLTPIFSAGIFLRFAKKKIIFTFEDKKRC